MSNLSNNFHCPFCGGAKFSLTDDNDFLCSFCGKNFNFDVDNLSASEYDPFQIKNLKEIFKTNLHELYIEKRDHYTQLLYYKKLAYPTKLLTTGIVLLFISIIFIYFVAIMLITLATSIVILVLAHKQRKKCYEEYKSYVNFHASKIVACDEKISILTKLLSKLTM